MRRLGIALGEGDKQFWTGRPVALRQRWQDCAWSLASLRPVNLERDQTGSHSAAHRAALLPPKGQSRDDRARSGRSWDDRARHSRPTSRCRHVRGCRGFPPAAACLATVWPDRLHGGLEPEALWSGEKAGSMATGRPSRWKASRSSFPGPCRTLEAFTKQRLGCRRAGERGTLAAPFQLDASQREEFVDPGREVGRVRLPGEFPVCPLLPPLRRLRCSSLRRFRSKA